MRKLILGIIAFLFLIPLVSADVIFPIGWSLFNLYLIIGIIIIETIVFWLLATKSFKIKIGFWKSLLIVAVANIITSCIGYLLPIHTVIYYILIAFIISVVVEWGVYVLFLLKQKKMRLNLLAISLIVNVISYVLLSLFNVF